MPNAECQRGALDTPLPVQYSTVQYSTVQYSTVQCSTEISNEQKILDRIASRHFEG